MKDESQNIIETWKQQQITEYLLQRMQLIQGDVKMKRNARENLAWLINFNGDLNKRIAKDLLRGNKVTGLIELRNEVTEWIKVVSPLAFPEGL
nr:hypothetical protein [uncultured Draconibacterium sp.]